MHISNVIGPLSKRYDACEYNILAWNSSHLANHELFVVQMFVISIPCIPLMLMFASLDVLTPFEL